MEQTSNPFAVKSLVPEKEEPIYDHGYSSEQVEEITRKHKEISARDLNLYPVTIPELKDVIFPYQRIHRTAAFNLKAEADKAKGEKKTGAQRNTSPKVVREPKPKKLAKKQISERISNIVMARAMGGDVSDEDEAFFNEHTTKSSI